MELLCDALLLIWCIIFCKGKEKGGNRGCKVAIDILAAPAAGDLRGLNTKLEILDALRPEA